MLLIIFIRWLATAYKNNGDQPQIYDQCENMHQIQMAPFQELSLDWHSYSMLNIMKGMPHLFEQKQYNFNLVP